MIVQFLIESEDLDSSEWIDLYIVKDKISAYYMPIDLDDSVNVLYDGNFMTFRHNTKLIEYLLTKRFLE